MVVLGERGSGRGGAEKVVLGEWCWRAKRVKRSVAGKGRRERRVVLVREKGEWGSGTGEERKESGGVVLVRGGEWGEWGSGAGEERKESGGVVLVRGERRVGEWCW